MDKPTAELDIGELVRLAKLVPTWIYCNEYNWTDARLPDMRPKVKQDENYVGSIEQVVIKFAITERSEEIATLRHDYSIQAESHGHMLGIYDTYSPGVKTNVQNYELLRQLYYEIIRKNDPNNQAPTVTQENALNSARKLIC